MCKKLCVQKAEGDAKDTLKHAVDNQAHPLNQIAALVPYGNAACRTYHTTKMSSKRKEAPPTTPETLREAKRMRSPEWQGTDRWKATSPSDGPSFKAATPQSKIAHRLSPAFQSPKPGTPVTVTTSALDTKQTKVANEAKTGRIATIPSKLPNTASVSRKADKTLSTIVKAKNKKANGLPAAWRAELYGTRPGSAQARLEQLCTALHQEVEEQKKAKAVTSVPRKRTAPNGDSPPKKKLTLPSTSFKQSSSTSTVTRVATVPATIPVAAVTHAATKPVSIATGTGAACVATSTSTVAESNEMDVDDVEMNSPEPAALLSPPIPANDSMDCMEFDYSPEPKRVQNKSASDSKPSTNEQPKKAEKQKETNNDSQKAMSDLKTKYKEGLSAFSSYFYCVIDTNIFIEHYQDFQSFLSKKYKGRQPIVIIPYKVLHELDTVKHKKPQLASKIVSVVKFLHKMLRAKDARVKGQHPWDDTIELMPLLSPDDSIVNCALQVQTVAGDAQVVLVSNDCNMLTKALVANLNSCTMEELQSDYNF
ncbi:uncharacterized protein LOC3290542 isoform X1 [Anopheles gambiae]|uniref:PIN domain-containing protein n=2 Tax=gambiae species complex TaxID=44542 RepID=A0A6E8VAL4_ANOCL|nr:uncharacterized protein LOC120950028 [Anopheles coluzzii]XP_550812.4 uncharacterized protein LOC3290542 isoform X1 [Anopheles gambiae]